MTVQNMLMFSRYYVYNVANEIQTERQSTAEAHGNVNCYASNQILTRENCDLVKSGEHDYLYQISIQRQFRLI